MGRTPNRRKTETDCDEACNELTPFKVFLSRSYIFFMFCYVVVAVIVATDFFFLFFSFFLFLIRFFVFFLFKNVLFFVLLFLFLCWVCSPFICSLVCLCALEFVEVRACVYDFAIKCFMNVYTQAYSVYANARTH